MGLLIAMIGMVSVGLIVADPKTLLGLGDLTDDDLQLSILGILLVSSLLYHNVQGAILIGIGILTLASWYGYSAWPSKIVDTPYVHDVYWNPAVLFDLSQAAVLYPAVGAFALICIFDISGVLFELASLQESGGMTGAFQVLSTPSLRRVWGL